MIILQITVIIWQIIVTILRIISESMLGYLIMMVP